MPEPPQTRVAVLSVMLGAKDDSEEMLRVHASVPYVSSLQHGSYPYVTKPVSPQFVDLIDEAVLALRMEVSTGRRVGSPRIADVHPKDVMTVPRHLLAGEPRYRMQLARTAQLISETLPLGRITEFLFSLENHVDLIQIFTNLPHIPWDWLYSPSRALLMCELYGIGTTMTEEEKISSVLFSTRDQSLRPGDLQSTDYSAIVVGNCYSGKHALPGIEDSVDRVARLLRPVFGNAGCHVLRSATASEVREAVRASADDVRIIVLSGHFSKDGFRCEDTYFGASDLHQAFDDAHASGFGAQPVVVLNGCSSGDAGASHLVEQSNPSRTMAQTMLRFGADACIYTSAQVRMLYASTFVEALLRRVLAPGVTLGNALLHARNALDKEKSYEWATYHLLGDPTYIMLQGDSAS